MSKHPKLIQSLKAALSLTVGVVSWSLLVAGCAGGSSSTSATNYGPAQISATQVTTSGSYLSMDIDTTNKLAYLGASYGSAPTTFFDVVDFSTEATPVLLNSIGSASTPSTTSTQSRGIAYYNNGSGSGNRLLVASAGNSQLELWNLTSTPRTGTWGKMQTLTGLTQVRKIASVNTSNSSQTVVTLALRGGIAIVNIAEPAGTMTLASSNTTNWGGTNGLGNGAVIGNWMFANNANLGSASYFMDLTTLASDGTYTFTDPGTGSTNLWTTAASSDQSKIFTGGAVGAFFSYNLSTPATLPVVTYRFNTSINSTGGTSRDAVFVTESGKTLLYTVQNTPARIDVWDVSNIAAPVQLYQQFFTGYTTSGEPYGIRVDPVAHRAYVATSAGQFFVMNTQSFAAPTIVYPTY